MDARVRSVNLGGRRGGIRSRGHDTGIDKRPVDVIEVRDPGPKKGGLGSGVVGDEVVSRKHHGGSRQAVYAVAREELEWWGTALGRSLDDGMFGENLTSEGLEVDGAFIGEQWRVGTAVLEVAGPRIPCATFAAWMGERGWVRRFTERGRTGAYLAVVQAGRIARGDIIDVVDRPTHRITVPDVFRAFTGDMEQAQRVLEARVLTEVDHAELEARTSARVADRRYVPPAR
jgi:MOSC domain-containing protein YiiM